MSWLVRATLSAALAAAAALVGCSFDWNATPEGSGGSGTGTGGAGGSGTGGSPTCSPTAPTVDAACDPPPMHCEYTNDPRPECRPLYNCENGHWEFDSSCACAPPTDSICPQDPGSPPASACPGNVIVVCQFSDGSHCGCEADGTWVCPPPPEDGCPPEAPNVGTTCPEEDLECNYGDCDLGTRIRRICGMYGRWWDDSPPCNEPVTCL